MATFWNYREDKIFWFVIYLELAAAICQFPSLSVKNSSFKDNIAELNFPINIAERETQNYGTKQKRI